MQYPESHPIRLEHNSAQIQGARERQEDSICAAELEAGLFGVVIADGVGGNLYGDWASRTAVEVAMKRSWLRSRPEPLKDRMREAIQVVDAVIRDAFPYDPRSPATTLILAVMDKRSRTLHLAAVGDSLVWHLHDGVLDRPLPEPEIPIMYGHAIGPALRYAAGYDIGDGGEGIDYQEHRLRVGDRLLFSSDGIEVVTHDEIRRCLEMENCRAATDALLKAVLEKNDDVQDNVSFIVVFVEPL